MAIDTLAAVKTILCVTGTADDDLLTELQAAADSFVGIFCGRSFEGGAFVEDHPGGGRLLFLRNYPVIALTSVKVDAAREFAADSLVPAVRYAVHADRGVIEMIDGTFVPTLPGWNVGPDAFPGAVRVAYTTATGAVPAAVRRAYADLIGHWFRQSKTHAATGQQNVTGCAGTTYPWGQSTGYRMPESVLALLRPFRVPAM